MYVGSEKLEGSGFSCIMAWRLFEELCKELVRDKGLLVPWFPSEADVNLAFG